MRLFLLVAAYLVGGLGICRGEPIRYQGVPIVLGEYIEYAVDSDGSLTAEDALKAQYKTPGPGVPTWSNDYAYWVRFSLARHRENKNLRIVIDNPMLKHLDFYRVSNGVPRAMVRTGVSKPFPERLFQTPLFIFDVPYPVSDIDTFLFRLDGNEQIVFPATISSVVQANAEQSKRDFIIGLYAGIMLVMAIYNLFIALSTRDLTYFYYVLFVVSIALAQLTLTGYTYKYLFPNNPYLFNQAITGTGALSGITAIIFICRFLHTKSNTPLLHKLLIGIAVAYSGVLLVRLLGFDEAASRGLNVIGLVAAVVVYWVVIKLMRQGSRSALLFFVAWTVFIAGLVLFVLRNVGLLPYNNITNYTMQAGTALEGVLLSFALADKINFLKRQNEAAQRAALEAAQANERLVKEQNIKLEEAVAQRTLQLTKSKANLENTLTNLKAAQTQLVEQEKMASLGQLTAGIAHEINNPINFVTSNISPIRRDLDEIFEVVNSLQATATADLTTEQRQKAVSRTLADADFDYLKEEVSVLLAGVQEGSSRTAEIVKGLRLFSRLDENDLKYSDVNQGMDATLIIINTLMANKIELDKSYDQVPPIECYAGQLNQVWLNILSNAIHAIKSRHGDKPGGKITVRTRLLDHSLVVSIGDNGTGMNESTKRKIFEPFFTTKEVGEGTGLGMSIVYNTIQKHHGDIRIDSEVGEGTTFHISLPLVQPS